MKGVATPKGGWNMRTWILWLGLAVAAWSEPTAVGKVESLAGAGNLMYHNAGKSDWYRAFVDMDNFKGQHLKTDAQTRATLRFHLGGVANLAQGSEIEIVGDRDVQVVGNTLLVKSGTLWAKVDKQKKDLKVKTAGGVMAIKGTEFVVSVQESGETRLALLEGEVVVQPDQGEAYEAVPGADVVFGAGRPLVAELRSTEELLKRLRAELGEQLFDMRQQLFETRQQMQAFRQDMLTTADELRQAAYTTRDSLLQSLGGLRGSNSNRGTQMRTGASAWLVGGRPHFSLPAPATGGYQLLLTRGDSFERELYWSARTNQGEVDYPSDARPLESGTYRWRAWPVDSQGQPQGRPLEGQLRVP